MQEVQLQSKMQEVQMRSIPYSANVPVTTTCTELLPVEIHNLEKVSHHPNVQTLLEYTYRSKDKVWVMVLEYSSEWEPLTNLTTAFTRVLDEEDIRDIIQQLLSAVVHCLQSGVDHRDIAVESMFLNRDTNQIYLANFQHSVILSVLPHTLQATQTSPSSVPPELYRRGQFTPHDGAVWSVGCVLFELISRAKPLLCKADVATNNIRWEELQPSSMSSELYELILMCLNPSPEHRLSLEELTRHPWIVNETYV